MKGMKVAVFILGFIILSIPVFADTVYLKDGRVYRGKYIKGDKNGVQFRSDDKMMGFPVNAVSYISVGEKNSDDREANKKGEGVLQGVVTCGRSIDSRLNSSPQWDFGAKVYAYRLRVNGILIFYRYDELLQSVEIDDFIKDYIRYRWAKGNRKLLSRPDSKNEKLKDLLAEKQSQLKKLGADTEKGWEEVRDRGRAIFGKLDNGKIPSVIAIAEREGKFSFRLPAGCYFLLAQSEKNRLEDAYAPVKILDGQTTQVSLEITFPDSGTNLAP